MSTQRDMYQLSSHSIEVLRKNVGQMKTAVLQDLDRQLVWYRTLPAHQRAELGQITSSGINGFVEWLTDPAKQVDHLNMHQMLAAVFAAAPRELSRSINLRHASQLMRTVLESVETTLPSLLAGSERATAQNAVVRYSRELAFALADVYARAAEHRGSWDARLEASLLDSVLHGHEPDTILSRASSLGWRAEHGVVTVSGSAREEDKPTAYTRIRSYAGSHDLDVLIGILSDRIVLVLGGVADMDSIAPTLAELFAPGPVVYGPIVDSLLDAHHSAQATFAAYAVAHAWTDAPRPVDADQLLPERALNQDQLAVKKIVDEIFIPLADAPSPLLETVESYLHLGASLEATARKLFIHSNTVRYRLRQVYQLTGLDPQDSRDAYVLHVAMTVGRLYTER